MRKLSLIIFILLLQGNVWAEQVSISNLTTINDNDETLEIANSQSENHNAQVAFSCTCYGGPGYYRYECAPVAKTCYGGPGYYPYTCWVCP
jgi:hypothetical protein